MCVCVYTETYISSWVYPFPGDRTDTVVPAPEALRCLAVLIQSGDKNSIAFCKTSYRMCVEPSSKIMEL